MKKNTFAFALLLFSNQMFGQVFPWHQCDQNSCWAASLAMVSKKVDQLPKSQYHFIQVRNSRSVNWSSDCSCKTNRIAKDTMFILAKENILGYSNITNLSLGLHHINALTQANKPIIYNYLTIPGTSHIVVMDSVEKITFPDLSNIAFIKIKDPWPQCKGNEYFITYERYYAQYQTEPSKYTIFFSNNCKQSKNIYVNKVDKNYLKNIIYHSSSEAVVQLFLNKLKASPNLLSSSFYNITKLNKSIISTTNIANTFRVKSISKATYINDSALIHTLLNFDFQEKITTMNQNNIVTTIVSTSNKKEVSKTYLFYNNWIIYHIEDGTPYQIMFELIRQAEMTTQIIGEEGLILRCADTYFVLLKKNSQYFVYDLYGDGLQKLNPQISTQTRFMAFETFKEILRQYLNKQ